MEYDDIFKGKTVVLVDDGIATGADNNRISAMDKE